MALGCSAVNRHQKPCLYQCASASHLPLIIFKGRQSSSGQNNLGAGPGKPISHLSGVQQQQQPSATRPLPYLLPQKRYSRMKSIPEMSQITACRDLAGGSRAFSFGLGPRSGVQEVGNSVLLHLLPSQCSQPCDGPWGSEVVH